jgi:plasmid maintenance system antidote protein VapI
MSQAELAERTGRPKKTINEIIKGKAMITSETAIQFERVLGVPASFWIRRDADYRAHVAKVDEAKQLEKHLTWPQEFPLEEMRKLGWISRSSSGVDLVREMLDFLGIASPANFDPVYAMSTSHFRKSPKYVIDGFALAAWLRKGELAAIHEKCDSFNRQCFVTALKNARGLTLCPPKELFRKLKELFIAAGVIVEFVPELSKIRTNGATRWISQDKALIQLSFRYKRADILWFTFFHEAGHILLHGKKDMFVEVDAQEGNDKELEADAFARDILIPNQQFEQFVAAGAYSKSAVQEFASAMGIHPGIVVGRLQHEGVIPHSLHCNMFMRLNETVWVRSATVGASPGDRRCAIRPVEVPVHQSGRGRDPRVCPSGVERIRSY